VTKNLLSGVPPCFGRHVKALVPTAFAVVSTHESAMGRRGGLWPVLLVCKPEGLCPSCGDNNRLMMMMMTPETDCDQTAMGLPHVKFTLFLLAKLV
jgi:hypothetical protein